MSVGQSITLLEASESQATDETEEFEFGFASMSILTKTCVSACRPSDEFVSNALRRGEKLLATSFCCVIRVQVCYRKMKLYTLIAEGKK